MKAKNWLELIQENRKEITAKGLEAYKSAWENQHLQFNIELYADGSLEVWHESEGENNFKENNKNDSSIVLFSVCHSGLIIPTYGLSGIIQPIHEVLDKMENTLERDIEPPTKQKRKGAR
ncbi:MAG: hypothetical protein ACK5LL_13755 [Suipraeoptans sp.]